MSFTTALLVAITMLLGNAFFVGAEFGLISARRSSIDLRARRGSRAAKTTLGAMEQISSMLAGAQLGVTLCSLVLGAVGEPLLLHLLEKPFQTFGISDALLHPLAFVLAMIVMVYMHVVIGEMVPKNLALAGPERAALLLTPPLAVIVRTIRPIVAALNWIANSILGILGVKMRDEITSAFTHDEVAGFVEESRREGLLSQDEGSLLSGALQFSERSVRVVLLPLQNLVVVGSRVTPGQIEKLVSETGFSRFPVRNSRGDIAKYIHLKDILEIDESRRDDPVPARVMRTLVTIKASTSLHEALTTMQQSGAHLARVTDSRNNLLGIITLEDVLEEFVGEIRDDSQRHQPQTAR